LSEDVRNPSIGQQYKETGEMKKTACLPFTRLIATIIFSAVSVAWGTGQAAPAGENPIRDDGAKIVVAKPFTANKYARRVRVLPNSKLQFLHNERYPMRIARDASGRLMMQVIHSDELSPECDRLELSLAPLHRRIGGGANSGTVLRGAQMMRDYGRWIFDGEGRKAFKNTRTSGTVPFGATGATTCATLHSLPFRVMMLPMVGVTLSPVTSSSTSSSRSCPLY
jgi:hypothetical protein